MKEKQSEDMSKKYQDYGENPSPVDVILFPEGFDPEDSHEQEVDKGFEIPV